MSQAAVITIRQADLPFRPVDGDGAHGLSLARLYQNPEHFTFQLAQIDPGGISKRHQHPWEQVNWVVAGQGQVEAGDADDGDVIPFRTGDCLIIPGGVAHAIANTSDVPLLLVATLGPGAA